VGLRPEAGRKSPAIPKRATTELDGSFQSSIRVACGN